METKIKRVLNPKSIVAFLIFLVLILGMALGFRAIGVNNIKNFIDNAGVWGPILFILIHAATIVMVPIEGSFLMISSGTLFGYWRGVIFTIIAGILGSSVNFWLGRKFGENFVDHIIGEKGVEKLNNISNKVNKNPFWLIPLMASGLFDIVGYAAGLTKVRYRKFFAAVLMSSFINVPIYVALGSNLIESNDAHVWLIWAIAGFVILFIAVEIWLYLRERRKRIIEHTSIPERSKLHQIL